MKKGYLFLFALLTLTFLSVNAYSQFQYGFCEANVTGTGAGTSDVRFTNPHGSGDFTTFAGLITATINGVSTSLYCNDITRSIGGFPIDCYRDSAVTDPKIVYILNNYYPHVTNPPGKLSNNNKEAAATQLAIWSFSDGVNLNTVTVVDNSSLGTEIRNRAIVIRADALANGTFTEPVATIEILSSSDPDFFYIRTEDQDGNPVAVNSIQLTISIGSLNPTSVNTDASGNSPDVEVIGTGTGIITATANVIIPQGITFTCSNKQKLVLAKPTVGERRAEADWGALPVELSSFAASVNERNVTLNWSTVSEINNSGFSIERKSITSSDWTTIGNVAGHGTISVPQNYSFTDRNLATGSYNYRLKQIDFNGNFEYFNLTSDVEIGIPSKFNMSQNYPNPFNPTTNINYSIAGDGFVSIKVFDNLGREAATLVNEYKTAGHYSVDFSGANLTSGLYFYRMETNGFIKVMKMTLVK